MSGRPYFTKLLLGIVIGLRRWEIKKTNCSSSVVLLIKRENKNRCTTEYEDVFWPSFWYSY